MTRKFNFNSFSVVVPIYNEEKIFLESAYIEFDVDDEAQSERFMDKDWETETIFPTLKITDKSKKEEFIEFNGGDFFSLEMVY